MCEMQDQNNRGLFCPWNILLGHSPTSGGNGVFASAEFKEGDVVEVCPIITIKPVHVDHPLFDFLYSVGDGQHKGVVLGYGMLYNCSQSANVQLERLPDGLFRFVATQSVHQGEELIMAPGERWCDSISLKDTPGDPELHHRWNIQCCLFNRCWEGRPCWGPL
eukprot:GGOE01024084.1.p1 GENE.GGOE01024084.1~~GGOE01024084.1.p1  ORF type:complete len:182 (-),score=12.64 GGOE01024084.1:67-555(-)